MKLLAADIGNTNLTLGLFDEGELLGSWRATTDTTATDDEIAVLVDQLLGLDGHALAEVDAVAIASVVPPLTTTFARMIRARTGQAPLVVDARSLEGILEIEIDRPAEAGADRLANALAARIKLGGPAIVIDLGTSTNFDLVSAEGAYIGGAIAPGLGLSLEALVGSASKLPRIELRRPPHAIGSNTVHAMQSGTVLGSIAADKAVLLVRRLIERGATVDVALTRSATAFITPLTFASLTHRPVVGDVMDLDADQQIAHIELAEAADAVVIAPATANVLAELAIGMASSPVTAIACASRAPVVVAPAMDAGMWTNPATQRNVATLREYGYLIVEPEVGSLASGLTGIGRLAEPATIADAVDRLFERAGDLEGLRVVVSAGGTREPIDPVRFIGNRSSGKMGTAIAEAARDRGATVTLIAGAMSVNPPPGVNVVNAATAQAMRQAVMREAPGADILVMAAAVADFAPKQARGRKIKRDGAELQVELVPNPDIIAEVGEMPAEVRPVLIVFAAESQDLEANAIGKLRDTGR